MVVLKSILCSTRSAQTYDFLFWNYRVDKGDPMELKQQKTIKEADLTVQN